MPRTRARSVAVALFAALVAVPAAAFADNGTWSSTGGGASRFASSTGEPPVSPETLWYSDLSGNSQQTGCITADQDRVYSRIYRNDGSTAMQAYDRATGSTVWSYAGVGRGGNDCSVLASGRVVAPVNGYLGTGGTVAVGLNAATGAVEWTLPNGSVEAELSSDGINAYGVIRSHPGCPTLALSRINAATGAIDWCVDTGIASPAIIGNGVIAVATDPDGQQASFMSARSIDDGHLLWSAPGFYPVAAGGGQLLAAATASGGLTGGIALFDIQTGALLWTATYPGGKTNLIAPVMDANRVYVSARSGSACAIEATAFNRATGALAWGPVAAPTSGGCDSLGVMIGDYFVAGPAAFAKADGTATALPQAIDYKTAFFDGVMYRRGGGGVEAVRLTGDTVPPTVSAESPTAGATVTTNKPTFAFSASDARSGIAQLRITIDGATTTIPVGSTSYTPTTALAEGAHTWSIAATDGAGNSASSQTISFTVKTPLLVIPTPLGPIVIPRLP